MAEEIIFPRVDMDMTSGQISRWFFKDGDAVEKGQPLFEIETDKAAMEIDASISGILKAPAPTGTQIMVGHVVGWIAEPHENFVPPAASAASQTQAEIETALPASADERTIAEAPHGSRATEATPLHTDGSEGLRATPLARHLAKASKIAITEIQGSGPLGRVQARDIEAYQNTLANVRDTAPASHSVALTASSAPLHHAILREGQGDPLVFIHGFGADLNSWRPLIQAMGQGRTVFALDLPGHGQSPWQGATSVNTLVQAVAHAINEAGFSSLHLIGHSLGAGLATLAIKQIKSRVKSLFLISPAGLGPEINETFIDGFCRSTHELSLRAWMDLLVADPQILTDAFVRLTASARAQGQVAAAQRAVADIAFVDGAQSFSIRQALSGLTIPTRLVMGLEDRIIPPHHVNDLPGAVALHRLKGVGHMPHVEARELLARLIHDHVGS